MLSSLALKVNLENTTQSLENAWKVITSTKLKDYVLHLSILYVWLNFVLSVHLIIQELNEYLIQNGGKSISADDFEMDFGIDEFNGLIDELKNNNAVEQSSWRYYHYFALQFILICLHKNNFTQFRVQSNLWKIRMNVNMSNSD